MNNPDSRYEPPYLDDEEREIMEAFNTAVDKGEIQPPSEAERAAINAEWGVILKQSHERKAITLRLQNRDISRLKSMAKRRGIPYQTLVSSVLHQFANGDIIERQ